MADEVIYTPDGTPVALTRKRVKNLNLRVRPDGTVHLSVPLRTSRAYAQAFLDTRAGWIAERVRKRSQAARAPLVPATGPYAGTLPLWGELIDAAAALAGPTARPATFGTYLHEEADAAPRRQLATTGEHGHMGTGNGDGGAASAENGARLLNGLDPEALARRIDALYRREVARALPAVAAELEAAMGVHATRWSIRRMTSRWGSCTPKTGTIRISSTLAAYPPCCLTYVVAHELTHLIEPSHNARFHKLLEGCCPDARHARALLRQPARTLAEGARAGSPR